MTTPADTAGAGTDAQAEQPPSPAALRAQAGRLFNAVTPPGRYPLLREGDVLIGDMPTRGDRIIALIRKPPIGGHGGKIVLQAAHAGPDGRRVPSSGAAIAFDAESLPLFAALVARAVEVELRDARALHRQPPSYLGPTPTAPAAGSNGFHPAQPAETPPKRAAEAPFLGFAFEGDPDATGFRELGDKEG